MTSPQTIRASVAAGAVCAVLALPGALSAGEGFYRVAREPDGRWWCRTPWNARFVPLAVDHVNGWGFVGADDEFPYRRHVAAHYPSVEAWGAETLARLKAWGFNLLGANSDPAIRYRGELPYTVFIGFGRAFAGRGGDCAIPCAGGGRFPNVFHPDFPAAARRIAREFCRANVGNATLFGYFLDNELPWKGAGDRATGLFDAVDALAATNSAKRALTAYLAGREATDEAKAGFLAVAAERYFAETAAAIRAVDPGHLVLGARFAGWEGAHEAVWRAAGRHCDVVSVNLYPHVNLADGTVTEWNGRRHVPYRQVLDPLQACASRPVMVTEWSFPALDAGLPCTRGGGQRVPTQADRARASEVCARALLATPYVVGYSFFMWMDQPSDAPGENCNYGLVNLRGVPYRELTDMFARLQANPCALRGCER